MRRLLLALILFALPASAEEKTDSSEKQPIWTLQKSLCIWIYEQHRQEWGGTLGVKEPPFDAQDIETIRYILDNDIGRVEPCVEEQS